MILIPRPRNRTIAEGQHNQEGKFQVDQSHQRTPLLNPHSICYDGYSVTAEDPASSNVANAVDSYN